MNVRMISLFALLAACGGGGGSPGGPMNSAQCTSNNLQILFSPMFTYWDGVHSFQVPAVVQGAKGTDVTWNASDTSMVSLAPDPSSGGIMITVNNTLPGMSLGGSAVQVTISAQANGQCGTSTLTIAPAVEADDWHDGAVRYNDGIDLRPATDMGATNKTAACTNCHGATATSGPFTDVSHTPEQIAGFSDQDLDMIIRNGTVPVGGYFDSSIVSMDEWHKFHQWQMTDEELKGLLVYLRGLPPMPQKGSANFGGAWSGFGM
jgi:hypothetical protein